YVNLKFNKIHDNAHNSISGQDRKPNNFYRYYKSDNHLKNKEEMKKKKETDKSWFSDYSHIHDGDKNLISLGTLEAMGFKFSATVFHGYSEKGMYLLHKRCYLNDIGKLEFCEYRSVYLYLLTAPKTFLIIFILIFGVVIIWSLLLMISLHKNDALTAFKQWKVLNFAIVSLILFLKNALLLAILNMEGIDFNE
ncbi:hypothetical protein ACJX0J_038173, partial [Zea mays]